MSLPESAPDDAPLAFGPFVLDRRERRLTRDGGATDVPIQGRAFDLVAHLAAHAGTLVRKDDLFEAVWPGVVVGDAALTQAMRVARRALGDDASAPTYVETVPGYGYRFVAPVTRLGADLPATQGLSIAETGQPIEPKDPPVAETADLIEPTDRPVERPEDRVDRTDRPIEPKAPPTGAKDGPIDPKDWPSERTGDPIGDKHDPIEEKRDPIASMRGPIGRADSPMESQTLPSGGRGAPPGPRSRPHGRRGRVDGALVGAMGAALAGGALYGLALGADSPHPTTTIVSVTTFAVVIGSLGAGTVALGAALRNGTWLAPLTGALAGAVVGFAGEAIGRSLLLTLTGQMPGNLTGGLEGLAIGAALGLAFAPWRRGRTAALATALATMGVFVALALAGLPTFAGSLDAALAAPTDPLRLDVLAPGGLTRGLQVLLSAFEGLLYGLGIGLGARQ